MENNICMLAMLTVLRKNTISVIKDFQAYFKVVY